MLLVESLGGFDVDGDDKIAFSTCVYVGDALAAKGDGRTTLRTLGNFDLLGLAAENGDLDLRAESCLGEADGNLAIKVVSFSCKHLVRLNAYLDNKVARRSAVEAC